MTMIDRQAPPHRPRHATWATLCALALLATAASSQAAPGDTPGKPASAAPAKGGEQPVKPLPKAQPGDDKARSRTTSLPAKGLFQGDQLSEAAKAKLTELVIEALGLRVEVALLIPTGPWQIDGSGSNERDLTPARLNALRKFLQERGIDQKRIFVESRTDAKLKEPRLDVQLLGQPATD
jgi:OmpA-OmpF porin, OOP family